MFASAPLDVGVGGRQKGRVIGSLTCVYAEDHVSSNPKDIPGRFEK
jgi:hypothetical protein